MPSQSCARSVSRQQSGSLLRRKIGSKREAGARLHLLNRTVRVEREFVDRHFALVGAAAVGPVAQVVNQVPLPSELSDARVACRRVLTRDIGQRIEDAPT